MRLFSTWNVVDAGSLKIKTVPAADKEIPVAGRVVGQFEDGNIFANLYRIAQEEPEGLDHQYCEVED